MDRLYDGKSQAKSGKSQARVRNHKQNAETRNYMPKAASIKANAAMKIIPTK